MASCSPMGCVVLNSSGRPQLLAALTEIGGAKMFLGQEHHSHGASFVDLQHDAKKLG